ncbi:MAG: hydroxymethylglutaryl-CoA reductase [bacterium]|nr:hydroxymethylglutaryl-CoA reductase [bacterium]
MKIPSMILRQLYSNGSLQNVPGGVRFDIKNRLMDATLTRISHVAIDGGEIPLDRLTIDVGDGQTMRASDLGPEQPLPFPLRKIVHVNVVNGNLAGGKHKITFGFDTRPFGKLKFSVEDAISETPTKPERTTVPYDKDDDYSAHAIATRREFVEQYSGAELSHVSSYSFDAGVSRGNIENFTGVAQVPVGIAGPLKVNGEHAQGEFLVPLATTEGTLVASYNRGIKVLNLAGGVMCTVQDDCMQRAPVFVFDSAREARDFKHWIDANFDEIKQASETTSNVARLQYIDTYLSNKFAFLRFNFGTGDAAGQNMVGRATFAACSWILEREKNVRKFYLESNMATDKKASMVNVMRTRGKRVVAEATIARDILKKHMRAEPESLSYHANVGNIGAMISGANNNGCHSTNAITAMFIATGQDVANVSEASAGIMYTELTPEGDLYVSMTIPSLIVATFGGGTALPTQRECLEVMDCYGQGKVNKFAEIAAGVVLAGELSLASAISALDWVSSHERFGRNR